MKFAKKKFKLRRRKCSGKMFRPRFTFRIRAELSISWPLGPDFPGETGRVYVAAGAYTTYEARTKGYKLVPGKRAVDLGSGAGPLGSGKRARRDVQIGYPNERAARVAWARVKKLGIRGLRGSLVVHQEVRLS